jgi:serine/threonine protein phosphatase PrpC
MMVSHLKVYEIVVFGRSDIGLVRENNEDVWGQLPEIGFFALADGMGGHQAGEIAARIAITSLCKAIKIKLKRFKEEPGTEKVRDLVKRAIVQVNARVYKMSRTDHALYGMGTTLCCMLFYRNQFILAHVGDSRIYRLRDQKLEQLTKDHSLLRELIDQGKLNEEQATDFLYKNIITKAIGTEPKVDPAVDVIEVQPDDLFLMCTDGLSDLLSEEEMQNILLQGGAIQESAAALIESANAKGGRDNITVVIATVKQADASKNLSR